MKNYFEAIFSIEEKNLLLPRSRTEAGERSFRDCL